MPISVDSYLLLYFMSTLDRISLNKLSSSLILITGIHVPNVENTAKGSISIEFSRIVHVHKWF